MTIYTGTSGRDNITGTSAADIFDMSQGGNDIVGGADNNDRFLFGAELTRRDTIDGGAGSDSVELDGDYSGGLRFDPFMVFGVETFRFAAGHTYDITFDDTNFVGNATVDGGDLLAGDRLIVDLGNETDADIFVIGGAGDDVIVGGQDGNDFRLDLGGADDVTGGLGPDHFSMGAAFDQSDIFDGKDGSDSVDLNGDYSGGLTILKAMVKNVEKIALFGAFDYVLTGDNALLGNGDTLTINGSGMAATNHIEFDGSAVNKGLLILQGSPGDDVMTGSDNADTFTDSLGGADTLYGGKGDDTFNLFGSLDAADRIDGGKGADTLVLHGDYPVAVVFGSHTIREIETITLESYGSYNFVTDDGNVGAGKTLVVDGSFVSYIDSVTFNGVAELDGNFDITGGDGGDTFTGGELNDVMYGGDGDDRLNGFHGNDTLYGGGGADTLNGGLGLDTYVLGAVANSSGFARDNTLSFDANEDVFDTLVTVTGIDATVRSGALSEDTFVNDIQAAIGNTELAAFHAVIFHPDSGDLAGKRFLIIDANGADGCQAFQDYIVELTHFKHLGALSTANFI